MSSRTSTRRGVATIVAAACAVALTLVPSGAGAAIVPTVPLGTAAEYAVLAGSTVTNTGPSVLRGSLGLAPGTSVTGFPPGTVEPPATTNIGNGAANQAKSDLDVAYVDAAGRPLTATTAADLGNLTLPGGVYAGPSKGALGLTGTLTLDGANNPDSVFIFQTDSTLTTATSSTVRLINGAQPCNVFWQVGSSATLGTSTVFVGNILALTSITVNTGVTVQGRALARNGAVTLDDDEFTPTACATALPTTTTTTTTTPTTTTSTTTTAPVTTTTVPPIAGGDLPVGEAGGPTAPAEPSTGSGPAGGTGTATPTERITTSVASPGTPTELARTGSLLTTTFLAGLFLLALGASAVRMGRSEQ